MVPWLIPAIASVGAGLAGWYGQKSANDRNEKLAREQMSFQERMSSTSAQRSVEDYAKAGLNPALAYDRPASSPAGSLSRVEDAVGKGISSAMQAKALQQSMQIARDQSQADLELKGSQKLRNLAEGATSVVQQDLIRAQQRLADFNILSGSQTMDFSKINQPFTARSLAAKALIDEYGVAGARNISRMESRLGELSPQIRFWLGNARTAAAMMPRF